MKSEVERVKKGEGGGERGGERGEWREGSGERGVSGGMKVGIAIAFQCREQCTSRGIIPGPLNFPAKSLPTTNWDPVWG